MANEFFKPEDVISTYTSNEAVEDGILFDIDIILARKIPDKHFFLKYITAGFLEKGYWNDRCKNGVSLKDAGTADRCQSCPTWVIFANSGNKTLPCKEKTLNIPNILDLLSQAARIFRKKPADDYFASGRIELPSGDKQKIFIAQNETGRYTAMLPEDY